MSESPPQVDKLYTAANFETLGFHDCRLYGVCWDHESYSFSCDLDYIVKWVLNPETGFYNFWICRATLQFVDVLDVLVSLDWRGCPPTSTISSLDRETPNSRPDETQDWLYALVLHSPDGHVEMRATDFELRIHTEPLLCDSHLTLRSQHLPSSD